MAVLFTGRKALKRGGERVIVLMGYKRDPGRQRVGEGNWRRGRGVLKTKMAWIRRNEYKKDV